MANRVWVIIVYLTYLMINPTFDNIRKKYTNSTQLIFLVSILIVAFLIINFFEINKYLQIEFIQNIITKSTINQNHLNAAGITHGGYLSALIDAGAGTAAHRAAGNEPCVTISLDLKFIGA